MGNRTEDNRPRGAKFSALHDRVAQWYYSHGLFCSTYPISVIFCAICVTLLCCYPLLNLPLSSNPMAIRSLNSPTTTFNVTPLDATLESEATTAPPPWCYVQQVLVRAAVLPWTDNLRLGDAFRAPLYEAFKLLDVVRNYEDVNSTKTLGHVCLHVENIKKKNGRNDILPEYSCLVLSPANFWRQDVQEFSQDNSILSTVFNYQSLQKGKTSLSEILFGMHLSETGIKRYPLRSRQRIIQYAITLFLKDYDEAFIAGLRHKLHTIYPLHQDNINNNTKNNILNETVLIHYPGEVNYYEFIPLLISFVLLFLYYYFSVRKIEMIKSKMGMAFTVSITVFFSLFMTLGVCFFFGLTLCLQGKEIFPYLVILVGLENVLVLTKSVVTTPAHLDIKIRVAQGLSKEGWSITKNLLIEITILTIGIFTFVPVIQEFCIFSIVGLINDFFLQMSFFSTILGIDTRRMENLVDKNNPHFRSNLYQTHSYEKYGNTGMSRSKSQPRLNNMHTNIVAGQTQTVPERKIPKRLRLVNIWARTRFFQRAFMLLMVTWIAMILYSSGILEQMLLTENSRNFSNTATLRANKTSSHVLPILNSDPHHLVNYVTHLKTSDFDSDELNKLKHAEYSAPWMKLSTQHWPAILRKYNMSLAGLSIAVLPSVLLSHAISPEEAVLLRNPDEKYGQKFQWQALAAALDPIDFADMDSQQQQQQSSPLHHPPDQPFYPSSPIAIALVALLALISCLVLCYAVIVLYKCVCSRHYAEWRAEWFAKKPTGDKAANSSGDEATEVPLLLEAVPVVLDGHREEVECLATDGFSVVSSGLGSGVVKIWDTITGEILSTIDRHAFFSDMNQQKSPDPTNAGNDFYDYDTTYSDYGSGSPPSRDEYLHFMSFPSLKNRINTNFVNLHLDSTTPTSDRYDFDRPYKQVYQQHEEETRVRNRNHDTVRWLHSTMSNGGCASGGGNNGVRRLEAPVAAMRQCSTGNVAHKVPVPPIWCMDCIDNLIVMGCSDGRLEFWEGTTAKFKCLVEEDSSAHVPGVGITSVKIVGSRVIAARLCGTLDFLQLQTFNQGRPIDWNFTSAYRRTHIRTGSAGSIADIKMIQADKEDLRCVRVLSTRAHQQPITCLDCEGGNVVTGSADHTLKVFRLDDGSPKYTLHGHCGPITCLFIDRVCPATSGSGSQDGMLCVWDLLTGACMYSVQAHDGPVLALTYSASYVISLGADERTCVWERFQGHLLNAIALPPHCHAAHLLLLTPHLLVTSRAGGLALWDVRTGDCVRTIVLGHSPYVFVRQLLLVRDAILCDFGRELRIVRFPLITHKYD